MDVFCNLNIKHRVHLLHVKAALAMCFRNGKSVSSHDIDNDVDNDVRGPES